jgi:hypothetical protein
MTTELERIVNALNDARLLADALRGIHAKTNSVAIEELILPLIRQAAEAVRLLGRLEGERIER